VTEVKATWIYNPIGSFKRGDPFTITFVYPSNSKPFILKGGHKDIERWLLTYGEPCIIHNTYWHRAKSRSSITVKNFKVPILIAEQSWYSELWKKENISKRKKWAFIVDKSHFFAHTPKVVVAMKRLPRKWIKELNPYIDQKYVKHISYASARSRKEDYRMIRLEECDVDPNKQV
jgi:hypothetical protein